MKMTFRILAFVLFVTLLVPGCKPKGLEGLVPAGGQVLYDDNALEGAIVTFSPKSGTGRSATATTDANGMFVVGTMNPKDGTFPGEYQVTVTKYIVENPMTDEEIVEYTNKYNVGPEIISKSQLPTKYGTFSTSGLSASVPEKGVKDLKFELKSK